MTLLMCSFPQKPGSLSRKRDIVPSVCLTRNADSTKAGRVSFFIAESMMSKHVVHTQQTPVLCV